jgi:hypothetical protein
VNTTGGDRRSGPQALGDVFGLEVGQISQDLHSQAADARHSAHHGGIDGDPGERHGQAGVVTPGS